MRVLPLLLVLVLIAGCGDDGDDDGATGGDSSPAPVALEIRYDDGRGERATATLRCGDEPAADGWLSDADPAELCEAVLAERELLTEEPDPLRACTELYGGPQTAQVTGTLEGTDVDRRYSRENGCRIGEWDRLAEAGLLPAGG